MTFWQIFVRLLPRKPLAALAGLWWHVTGKRVRARNRLRAAGARLPFAYRFWMDKIEPQRENVESGRSALARLTYLPQFAILVYREGHSRDAAIAQSLESVERQIYPDRTVSVVEGANEFAQAIARATADFVLPLRAGDQLAATALIRYAEALEVNPAADVVFGDQDSIDMAGNRSSAWFKPAWNGELFLSQDYLSDAAAVRAESARKAVEGGPLTDQAAAYDLLLRVTAYGSPVVHAPCVTVHVRTDLRADDQAARLKALRRELDDAGAEVSAGPFGTVKVAWPLPSELPLVTVIIPTRDKVELLKPCVDTLLESTIYTPFEVIIVDNGSTDGSALAYLDQIASDRRVRVLSYPGAYNFSAINNFAVRESAGSYVCFLNNDTETVDGPWLTEMMRQAIRPEVAAVGAKLLYEDGTIQHAGVIVGIGDAAGHAHRNLPNSEAGYFAQVHAAQFVTAVTGACLLVEKRKFVEVGGFDERDLAIAYNDIDLCLKLERAGWRNVYVPHAILIHHESKSRGKDHSPSQIDRYRRELKTFQERWGTATFEDPLFNPNLERSSETFVIRL
jgi:GT2 family glycosyltransferase